MADVMPKTDENAAERERFHEWCREHGIDTELWMPTQPWCGYSNSRTQDIWLILAGPRRLWRGIA